MICSRDAARVAPGADLHTLPEEELGFNAAIELDEGLCSSSITRWSMSSGAARPGRTD